jgi:hypothetical protein
MYRQNVLLTLLAVIIFAIAIAVGLSLFAEQERQRKEETKTVSVTTVHEQKPEQPKVVPYYRCYDFGLPAGKVVGYSPSNDFIASLSIEEGMKLPDIFIHIRQDDGSVRVEKVTYQTWLKLGEGDILK